MLWNKLDESKKESRRLFQITLEESLLRDSDINYWNSYNRQPDEGIPEQNLLNTVVEKLQPLYQQWIDNTAKSPRCPAWVYPLFQLGAAKMADITIRSVMMGFLSNAFSKDKDILPLPLAQTIATDISNLAIDIIAYQNAKGINKEFWYKQSHYQKNWTVKRCKAFAKQVSNIQKNQWSIKQKHNFGHHMIRIAELSEVIKIVSVPVVRKTFRTERNYVTFTDEILNKLEKEHQDLLVNASILYRPMIVPPVEHTEEQSGGTLSPWLRKPMVQRFRDKFFDESTIQKNSTPSPMVIKGLNALMKTEFTINTKVLEVMDNLFKGDTRLGNLPAYTFNAFSYSSQYPKEGTKEEQSIWLAERESAWSSWYKEEASRARMLVRLRLARDMIKHGFFYHIFTCDFRGRAYTACDLLSPQSGDFDRSLLLYAEPIKQTKEGIYWLKVHLANLFDVDKCSFDDRVKWVDSNIKILKRINDDPYSEKSFWLSDKKKKNTSFQRLAAIYELFRTDGLTQLPIQQDGTCNGIQHWAALVRDETLASQVNLTNNSQPKDIYQDVADLVTNDMNSCKETNEWASIFLDHWNNKIPRSVVKRAVMTDPYGVTFYGIRKYCRTEGFLDWVSKENKSAATRELAVFIHRALKDSLVEANKGKAWLKEVATQLSNLDRPLEWTTPCGFHVVHRYNEIITTRSVAKLFNMKELHFGVCDPTKIDDRSVEQAIAPNFVHSLDASHMWCTISRMIEAGIHLFCMVHDSYGCPAPYVPMMREFTKEEFYKMYRNNILQLVKEELETLIGESVAEIPSLGTYNISSVLESNYMFQ